MGCRHRTVLEVRDCVPGFTTYSDSLFNKFSLNDTSDALGMRDEKIEPGKVPTLM